MRKRAALVFLLLAVGWSWIAEAKDWQTAVVIGTSETQVTSPMMREPKTIVHYTVETKEFLLLCDYTYHPTKKADESDQPGKNSPPSIALGEEIKLAISGHTAYLIDVHGNEVKMHLKKKTKL